MKLTQPRPNPGAFPVPAARLLLCQNCKASVRVDVMGNTLEPHYCPKGHQWGAQGDFFDVGNSEWGKPLALPVDTVLAAATGAITRQSEDAKAQVAAIDPD